MRKAAQSVSTALFIAAFVVWCAAALWVSVIDWRTGLIPRVIVWPATLIVAICLLVISLLERDPRRFGEAVLGGAAIGAFLLLFYVLRPGKIGGGDLRLVTLNGLIAGWWGLGLAWWSLFAGAFVMLPVALVKAATTTMRVRKEARLSPAEGSSDSESREEAASASASASGAPNGGNDGSDTDIQPAEEGTDDSPQSAVRQGLNTTLRAGPWLCAGTLAVVIYAWVEKGIV